MTLKDCTKAELLWLIDWMCTHSMFRHDIEIERALNALEFEREQKKLDGAFGRWPPCVKLSGAMPRP